MDRCKNCGGDVKVMTPPEKGICSENCKKEYNEKAGQPKQFRSISDTPRPQRGTSNYGS